MGIMTTKEKIISIFENFCYTIEDQAGDKIKVIDEDDFDKIAEEILETKRVKCDSCEEMVEMISTGECCPSCFC
jgi:flagellar basal body rod protein FlgG